MPTHAGQRLKRFLDAYGVTATQVEALLDLRHHAVTHLMKQSREHPLNARVRQAIVEHTGVDAEPTVVSAQAIIAERARQSLTLTEAAQLLAVSPSRLATIERTHAHLPLVLRLARPKEPRGR
jgi:transcriptional regulator with XRE-family HTH domain